MNIKKSIEFNPNKPTVLIIKKTEAIKMFCVGLCMNQILPKHQAKVPSFLIVLKGKIHFLVEGTEIEMMEFQTYQIPLLTDHEVKGIAGENIFLITQELT
jgi:quercetin dioxygenase-like cupin family protein